jgi:histidine ammonia-lyase
LSQIILTGHTLELEDVLTFESRRPEVAIADESRERMSASVDTVSRVIDADRVCYGINTGFGAFANRRISAEQVRELQLNLVRSHAAGTGQPLHESVVRRLMLLKANSLAAGHSGIRPEVVDTLVALLNGDVLPIIPGRGSVGASGDLAPLAHLALARIGEGVAMHGDDRLEGPAVTEAVGCRPVRLGAKEGLALLNGTQASAALAMQGLARADRLLLSSILAGAQTVESLAGSFTPFDSRIHEIRRMQGQRRVAALFRGLLDESEINHSHEDCDRVQDPYAVRCMPQVLGAVWDTLHHAAGVLARECNGVSDNPLIFGEDVLSGGNFHAEPLAFVSDFMAIAVAEIGSMSERRTDLLARRVNPSLTMFLTDEPGLESGIMIAHVTAAALASENKTLGHPASVDSIPTSAGQEDHVSMAPWAGHKLLRVCENTATILAIELLAGALAIDNQRPLRSTLRLEALHEQIRAAAPARPGDHRLDGEIAALTGLVREGSLTGLVPGDGSGALSVGRG